MELSDAVRGVYSKDLRLLPQEPLGALRQGSQGGNRRGKRRVRQDDIEDHGTLSRHVRRKEGFERCREAATPRTPECGRQRRERSVAGFGDIFRPERRIAIRRIGLFQKRGLQRGRSRYHRDSRQIFEAEKQISFPAETVRAHAQADEGLFERSVFGCVVARRHIPFESGRRYGSGAVVRDGPEVQRGRVDGSRLRGPQADIRSRVRARRSERGDGRRERPYYGHGEPRHSRQPSGVACDAVASDGGLRQADGSA